MTPALTTFTREASSPVASTWLIQALDSRVSCPMTTLALVVTLGESLTERASNRINGGAVQRIFAGDTADTIGPKKFAFEILRQRSAQGWPAPPDGFPVLTVT